MLKVLDGVEDSGSRSTRARRIRNFLSQPFFVAEAYTNRPGAYVPRQETIAAFAALLAGRYDHLPEEAFSHVRRATGAMNRTTRSAD